MYCTVQYNGNVQVLPYNARQAWRKGEMFNPALVFEGGVEYGFQYLLPRGKRHERGPIHPMLRYYLGQERTDGEVHYSIIVRIVQIFGEFVFLVVIEDSLMGLGYSWTIRIRMDSGADCLGWPHDDDDDMIWYGDAGTTVQYSTVRPPPTNQKISLVVLAQDRCVRGF
jgi:hypothetical protein